jgi:hypothetical protein
MKIAVKVPDLAKPSTFTNEEKLVNSALKIEKKIVHPGEVTIARYSHIRP